MVWLIKVFVKGVFTMGVHPLRILAPHIPFVKQKLLVLFTNLDKSSLYQYDRYANICGSQ
jgi:hypothetical protein